MHSWLVMDIDRSDGAGEVGGACLAALVEEDDEVDGHVEVDAQDVGFDGGAEADGRVEVGEPGQQWAALVGGRHAEFELEQVQHVGAHTQLQRVDRADTAAAGGRRRGHGCRGHVSRRWDGDRRGRKRDWGGVGAVRPAAVGSGSEEGQVHSKEEGELGGRHCYA